MRSLLPVRARAWTRRLALTAAATLCAGSSLSADTDTLLVFGGDMVTSSRLLRDTNPAVTATDLDGDGLLNDSVVGYPFSSTTRLSPAVGYTGPRFFGGIRGEAIGSASQGIAARSVANSTTQDFIDLRYQTSSPVQNRFWTVFYFDKADFIGAPTAPVKFDYLSRLSITTGNFANLGQVRWLVRDGDRFYVSEALVAANGSLTFGNNTDDGRWASYSPTANDLDFDPASADFATRDFQNITAVGLMTDRESLSTVRTWLQLRGFQLDAYLGDDDGTPNLAPTPVFSATPASPRVDASASFTAAASTDPEDDTLTYTWDFGDGTTATGVNASHTYATSGAFTVTLQVTDSFGNVASLAQPIVVRPPNVAPTASISTTPAAADVPAVFTLDASASFDSDGEITAYNWAFSDGTVDSGAMVTKTITAAGLYTATVLVTDNDGATSSTQATLKATINGTLPPVAAFVTDLSGGYAPLTLEFDAGASSDPDGTITAYAWDFGDGNAASGANVTHTYQQPGSFIATLTVTDDRGVSGTASQTFNVTDPIFTAEDTSPRLPGSYTVRQGTGTFTLTAGGVGLHAASGQHYYLHQTMKGDGEFAARVAGFADGAHPWASAGVMLRSTDSTEAAFLALTVTAAKGVHAHIRATDGGSTAATETTGAAPIHLKIARAGDVFTLSTSPDGEVWTVVTTLESALPETLLVGLVAAAGQNGRTTTATIDSVRLPRRTGSPSGGPTDNPVAAVYGADAYPWTNEIQWENVFNIVDFPGDDHMTRFIAARDAAVAAGGGVVYFPAGTYTFQDNLVLADGVVIRGDTPQNLDAKSAGYAPPTRFEFPAYVPSFTGSGTPNSTAFKQIVTENGDTDWNLGLVYIDVNRARINLQGSPANGVNRNYLVFGVRSNNVASPDPGVPHTTQQGWQRWSYRFTTNISVQVFENALVANNRINDAITDNFEQPGYVVEDTSQPVGSPGRLVNLEGHQAVFSYTDHYGIYVNRGGASGGYVTPETAPSIFREGIVIRDNWIYSTMRVKIHAAGKGLVIADNVMRDNVTKAHWVHPTGRLLVGNANTLENRGIDWSGHDVVIIGNDIEVFRHRLKEGPYYSVDGEGILHQECCGGSSIRGVLIEGNISNSYIGLYKSREIENAIIRGNTLTNGFGHNFTDLIYVNADTNNGPYYVKNVIIEDNVIQSGNNIRLEGDAAGGGTGNIIRNNTSTGNGTIKVSTAANAEITGNTGFTVEPF